jgi:hypothetical protein
MGGRPANTSAAGGVSMPAGYARRGLPSSGTTIPSIVTGSASHLPDLPRYQPKPTASRTPLVRLLSTLPRSSPSLASPGPCPAGNRWHRRAGLPILRRTPCERADGR